MICSAKYKPYINNEKLCSLKYLVNKTGPKNAVEHKKKTL